MASVSHVIEVEEEFDIEGSIPIWILRWRRFYKNKLAFIGAIILIFLYVAALDDVFFAPYGVQERF